MATTAQTRCFCSTFEFGTFDVDTDDDYTTECTESTTRVFAQGHDAKLVGYLVRAEMAGQEIRRGSVHFAGAVQAAAHVSEALAAKTQAQLDVAKARVAKKAAAAAAKAARKSTKAAEVTIADRDATIKVGRWTYVASISASGVATYKTKLGRTVTLAQGEYKEV